MRGDSTHALNRNPQLLYTPLQDSRSLVPLLYAQLISRLAQIGLWVCFMTTASNFGRGSYGSFSMIYGLNRFSLAADWGVVLLWKVWWEWNERKKERKARQEEHRAEENEQQSAETLESSTDATTHAQQSSDLSSPDPYTAQDDREVERTAPSEKPSPLPHGISKRGELISMISALISVSRSGLDSGLNWLYEHSDPPVFCVDSPESGLHRPTCQDCPLCIVWVCGWQPFSWRRLFWCGSRPVAPCLLIT